LSSDSLVVADIRLELEHNFVLPNFVFIMFLLNLKRENCCLILALATICYYWSIFDFIVASSIMRFHYCLY